MAASAAAAAAAASAAEGVGAGTGTGTGTGGGAEASASTSSSQAAAASSSSSTWHRRFVDYILVMGATDDPSVPMRPMRRMSRSNSQTILPISDLLVVETSRSEDVPQDFAPITLLDGRTPANLNAGMLRSPIMLCESRMPTVSKKSMVVNPITDIDLIFVDKREAPKPNFVQLPGNLNKGGIGRNIAVCVERNPLKEPIIDLIAINKGKGEECPPGFTLIERSVNAGGMSKKSKQVYLCYKKAQRRGHDSVAFQPALVDRYPVTDHKDYPLEAQGISMLCFPRGMLIKEKCPLPTFLTFVLTQADGSHVYGAALMFYEFFFRSEACSDGSIIHELDADGNPSMTPEEKQAQSKWFPKVLCVLSHHPFYETYKTFLNQLYRIAVSPSPLPIERYIGNFMNDIPVPICSKYSVKYRIGHAKDKIRLPPSVGMPLADLSFHTLFQCLSLDNVITVFEHLLGEARIIVFSNSYELLNPFVEALRTLIWPFRWQCIFIPVLPSNLSYTVRAPVPFLVGLHRTFLDEIRVADDVLLVDLDRNHLRLPLGSGNGGGGGGDGGMGSSSFDVLGEEDGDSITPLPAEMRQALHSELSRLAGHVYVKNDTSDLDVSLYAAPLDHTDSDTLNQEAIRVAFLRILILAVGNYRQFLKPGILEEAVFDLDALFDTDAHVQSLPENIQRFARSLLSTQMASEFLLQRLGGGERIEELFFFDWCVSLSRCEAADFPAFLNGLGLDETNLQRITEEMKQLASAAIAPVVGSDVDGGTESKDTVDAFDEDGFPGQGILSGGLLCARSVAAIKLLYPVYVASGVDAPDFLRSEDYIVPSPVEDGCDAGPYQYPHFPRFTHALFCGPVKELPLSVGQQFSVNNYHAVNAPHRTTLEQALWSTLGVMVAPATASLEPHVLAKSFVADIYVLWFELYSQHALSCLAAARITESPEEQERLALGYLMVMIVQLYSMGRQGIWACEDIMADLCFFAGRAGLPTELALLHRVFAKSVPDPSPRFFRHMAVAGVVADKLPMGIAPPSSSNSTESGSTSPAARARASSSVAPLAMPRSIVTQAQCINCKFELSGNDIISGWLAGKRTTSCPHCEAVVTPYLVVELQGQPASKVHMLRPSRVRMLLAQMDKQRLDRIEQSKHRKTSSSSTLDDTAEVPDAADEGKAEVANQDEDSSTPAAPEPTEAKAHRRRRSSVLAAIGHQDTIPIIRKQAFVFWNALWYFASRGRTTEFRGSDDQSFDPEDKSGGGSGGIALPFLFLYGRDSPFQSQPSFRTITSPYSSWAIIRTGVPLAANSPALPVVDVESQTSEATSPSPGGSARPKGKLELTVQYVMDNVKNKPIHQAVKEFLSGRAAIQRQVNVAKNSDLEFFNRSMYTALALLQKHPSPDLKHFGNQYDLAIQALDATMERQKNMLKAITSAKGIESETLNQKKTRATAALDAVVAVKEQMQLWDQPIDADRLFLCSAVMDVCGVSAPPKFHPSHERTGTAAYSGEFKVDAATAAAAAAAAAVAAAASAPDDDSPVKGRFSHSNDVPVAMTIDQMVQHAVALGGDLVIGTTIVKDGSSTLEAVTEEVEQKDETADAFLEIVEALLQDEEAKACENNPAAARFCQLAEQAAAAQSSDESTGEQYGISNPLQFYLSVLRLKRQFAHLEGKLQDGQAGAAADEVHSVASTILEEHFGSLSNGSGLALAENSVGEIRKLMSQTIEVEEMDPLMGVSMAKTRHAAVPLSIFDEQFGLVDAWLRGEHVFGQM